MTRLLPFTGDEPKGWNGFDGSSGPKSLDTARVLTLPTYTYSVMPATETSWKLEYAYGRVSSCFSLTSSIGSSVCHVYPCTGAEYGTIGASAPPISRSK